MSRLMFDETTYDHDDLVQIIAEQLREPYTVSDNLRTAAMYCPAIMTPKQWIRACAVHGVAENTARNRLSEVRRWQTQLGEIAPCR